MTHFNIEVDRKNNSVYIYIDDVNKGTLKLTIRDAYMLALKLNQELDRTNPLLQD